MFLATSTSGEHFIGPICLQCNYTTSHPISPPPRRIDLTNSICPGPLLPRLTLSPSVNEYQTTTRSPPLLTVQWVYVKKMLHCLVLCRTHSQTDGKPVLAMSDQLYPMWIQTVPVIAIMTYVYHFERAWCLCVPEATTMLHTCYRSRKRKLKHVVVGMRWMRGEELEHQVIQKRRWIIYWILWKRWSPFELMNGLLWHTSWMNMEVLKNLSSEMLPLSERNLTNSL